MKTNVSIGIKPLMFKIVIITMSICYVFGPAHNEVRNIIHSISHHFERPNFIIEHGNTTNITNSHDSHGYRNLQLTEHNHYFIDFVSDVLSGGKPDKKTSKSEVIVKKIDKHIKTNYELEKPSLKLLIFSSKNYCSPKSFLFKGYLKSIKAPPQRMT